ncbi:MAG: hydrogenase maturation protein [Rhizobacter sp.]|nr:hydrogenase maturation protein [Rhizobacter sp.]
MNILLLTTAHNSLSQRVQAELAERGHAVPVALATSEQAMLDAVAGTAPDLVVAPMLKKAIPAALWRKHTCLIVHPGIVGDRGPSSLDWALARSERVWGVTVLQADAEMDAGPVWASHEFMLPARPHSKASLYRNEVTEAAVRGVLDAVARFESGRFAPAPLDYGNPRVRGELRAPMKQTDRAIDWQQDTTAEVARKIRAADSSPGVLETSWGEPYHLYGAHEEDRLKGRPGQLIAKRHGAVCIGTVDGGVWVSHLKAGRPGAIKLPAAQVLGARLADIAESSIDFDAPADHRTFREIRYTEQGAVGFLAFDFYSGAMNTGQCRRLRDAYLAARARPTKVIVLLGGRDFFSNGIHLNTIEAADDAADESWRNIVAIDDLVLEIINTMSHLTVAALRGNAGAGGAMMALAADQVFARNGVVLNPHYKGMGGLHGSEYWTYLLPRRVGGDMAAALTDSCRPLGTRAAQRIGFIDAAFGANVASFEADVSARAEAMASDAHFWHRLKAKHDARIADERRRPLAAYRQHELARMRANFHGPDTGYHEARARFVHKGKLPATPAAPTAAARHSAVS